MFAKLVLLMIFVLDVWIFLSALSDIEFTTAKTFKTFTKGSNLMLFFKGNYCIYFPNSPVFFFELPSTYYDFAGNFILPNKFWTIYLFFYFLHPLHLSCCWVLMLKWLWYSLWVLLRRFWSSLSPRQMSNVLISSPFS